MSQIDDATCLPCPFCGFRPKADDDDFCYPILRDRSLWGAHCYETGGGCAAQVCANSRDEAIAAWNTRAHASPGPEVAQDQLAATPLPKGEQRAFVEGAGGSAATHEIAAAIERVRAIAERGRDNYMDLNAADIAAIRLVCAAASRAPGRESVAWRVKLRINCGQGQFTESGWKYLSHQPKPDPDLIAAEPLYTADAEHSELLVAKVADAEYTCGCNVLPWCSVHGSPLVDAAEAAPGDGTCSST